MCFMNSRKAANREPWPMYSERKGQTLFLDDTDFWTKKLLPRKNGAVKCALIIAENSFISLSQLIKFSAPKLNPNRIQKMWSRMSQTILLPASVWVDLLSSPAIATWVTSSFSAFLCRPDFFAVHSLPILIKWSNTLTFIIACEQEHANNSIKILK